MSKTQGKNTKNRPSVAPAPRRAPVGRSTTPPVGMPRKAEGANDGEENAEGTKDPQPPVAEGQAVEQPVDSQAAGGGSQSGGQGGGGNQP